jgi:hypothetical protein
MRSCILIVAVLVVSALALEDRVSFNGAIYATFARARQGVIAIGQTHNPTFKFSGDSWGFDTPDNFIDFSGFSGVVTLEADCPTRQPTLVLTQPIRGAADCNAVRFVNMRVVRRGVDAGHLFDGPLNGTSLAIVNSVFHGFGAIFVENESTTPVAVNITDSFIDVKHFIVSRAGCKALGDKKCKLSCNALISIEDSSIVAPSWDADCGYTADSNYRIIYDIRNTMMLGNDKVKIDAHKDKVFIGHMPYASFEEARAAAELSGSQDVTFEIDQFLHESISLRGLTGNVTITRRDKSGHGIFVMPKSITDVSCAKLTIDRIWLNCGDVTTDLPLFDKPLNGTSLEITHSRLTTWYSIDIDNQSGHPTSFLIKSSFVTLANFAISGKDEASVVNFDMIDSLIYTDTGRQNVQRLPLFSIGRNVEMGSVKTTGGPVSRKCTVDRHATPDQEGFGYTLFNSVGDVINSAGCHESFVVVGEEQPKLRRPAKLGDFPCIVDPTLVTIDEDEDDNIFEQMAFKSITDALKRAACKSVYVVSTATQIDNTLL